MEEKEEMKKSIKELETRVEGSKREREGNLKGIERKERWREGWR